MSSKVVVGAARADQIPFHYLRFQGDQLTAIYATGVTREVSEGPGKRTVGRPQFSGVRFQDNNFQSAGERAWEKIETEMRFPPLPDFEASHYTAYNQTYNERFSEVDKLIRFAAAYFNADRTQDLCRSGLCTVTEEINPETGEMLSPQSRKKGRNWIWLILRYEDNGQKGMIDPADVFYLSLQYSMFDPYRTIEIYGDSPYASLFQHPGIIQKPIRRNTGIISSRE